MSKWLVPKEEDIELYKDNTELVKQTAEQIIKDFAMFGMEISFSGNIQYAYDELFDQLYYHLEGLFQTQSDKLNSLLYQIDIDPRLPGQENSNISTLHDLSDAILRREFMKVLTRWFFKNNM